MKHIIILPDLGQTTSEAKILQWHKKPGDLVSSGEPLVEVETDKATMDVEAYVGGYLRATLVEEGQMATAKDPIAVLTDTRKRGLSRRSLLRHKKPCSRQARPSKPRRLFR